MGVTTDIRTGVRLGGYVLGEKIGRGGMGVVYRATHDHLGREVALKVLAPELSGYEDFRERFLRESRLAAVLEHPNVVTVYDAGESDGTLYIAMRYVRGSDLSRFLREQGALAPATALAMLDQVAAALDAAHRLGLIHRDVKPGNVLLAGGNCYLTDFGLTKRARAGDASAALTKTGQFLGTIDYVAPEQIEGRDVDGRADIYALTCMLHECLTGSRPFPKESEVAIICAHLYDPPPRPSTLRPELPAAIDDVVARGMAKSRDDRYATCSELMAAAREALSITRPAAGAPGGASTQSTVVRSSSGPWRDARVSSGAGAGGGSTLIASRRFGGRERRSARRRNRVVAMLAAAVAAAAALAAVVAVVLSAGTSSSSASRTASSAAISISYPRSWHPSSRAGLGSFALGTPEVGAAASAARSGGRPIALSLGQMTLGAGLLVKSAPIPAGAPPELVARFGQPTSASDARVADAAGRAYTWAPAGQRLVAYVVPTTLADAAVICAAPFAGASLAPCTELAGRAKLSGVLLLSPGPDLALRGALGAPIADLASVRDALHGLRGSFAARARAAKHVAGADAQTAAAIARITGAPRYGPQLAALAGALRSEQRSFTALSDAARARNRGAYARAANAVQRASARVGATTAAFGAAGLHLPALPALRLAPPPPKPAPPAPTSSTAAAAGTTSASASSTPASGSSAGASGSTSASGSGSTPASGSGNTPASGSTPAPAQPQASTPAATPSPSRPAPSRSSTTPRTVTIGP